MNLLDKDPAGFEDGLSSKQETLFAVYTDTYLAMYAGHAVWNGSPLKGSKVATAHCYSTATIWTMGQSQRAWQWAWTWTWGGGFVYETSKHGYDYDGEPISVE